MANNVFFTGHHFAESVEVILVLTLFFLCVSRPYALQILFVCLMYTNYNFLSDLTLQTFVTPLTRWTVLASLEAPGRQKRAVHSTLTVGQQQIPLGFMRMSGRYPTGWCSSTLSLIA